MFAYQQNANRLNMFAVLSKNSRNQVQLDYGTYVHLDFHL